MRAFQIGDIIKHKRDNTTYYLVFKAPSINDGQYMYYTLLPLNNYPTNETMNIDGTLLRTKEYVGQWYEKVNDT